MWVQLLVSRARQRRASVYALIQIIHVDVAQLILLLVMLMLLMLMLLVLVLMVVQAGNRP